MVEVNVTLNPINLAVSGAEPGVTLKIGEQPGTAAITIGSGIGPAAVYNTALTQLVGVSPVAAGKNISISTTGGSYTISADDPPVLSVQGKTGQVSLSASDLTAAAAVHTHSTTSIVGLTAAIQSFANVVSVQGRTGAVVLTLADITAAAATHTHLAANITDLTSKANVVSVNGRTGSVTLTLGDFSGASSTHTHLAANITDLTTKANVVSVNGKTGVVSLVSADVSAASATHTHVAADITDLTTKANVASVNGITGAPVIVGGSNVTVAVSQSSITVSSGVPTHTHVVADVTNLQTLLDSKAAASHQHAIADVTGLQTALNSKQAAGNYATLVNGLVPTSQLPSYVDDIIDAGGSLPATGEVGKLYVITSGTSINRVYRWSGSVWVEIVASPGTTDSLVEGTVNLYFTNARAVAAVQSQLDAKAPLSHTHPISQVVGLQSSLDSKAASSHVHVIADVSGLQTSLNGKAALSHQHVISEVANLQSSLDAKAALTHQHVVADVSGLQALLDSKQPSGTYATLVGGKVPTSQLPSYVDDVVDVGSSLPLTGDTGVLYVISSGVNANRVYRWTGSAFIEIVGSPGTTDALTEGVVNLYFTNARAVSAVQSLLNGKAALVHQHVIGDVTGLQSSLNSLQASIDAKAPLSHTHAVSEVVGLQAALDGKSPLSHGHSISEIVGLTSALDGKALLSHTHAMSEIVGLTSALSAKAELFHQHVIADVSGLQNSLNSKAPLSHTHAIADVTNLESRLQFASTLTTPPASDTASGTAGQLALDATYLYGCVATNTWKRIPWEAYGSGAAGITITAQPTNQTAGTSSGTVTMTSSSETIPGTFSYDGSAITTLKLNAAFYNNGTVQYATSSDYTNVLFVRESGTWSGMLAYGDTPVKAATSHGQRDYNSTNNPTIPHPYRYIAGNNSFTVLAKEEQNYQDVFNAAVIQPLLLSASDTTGPSPAFSAGSFSSSNLYDYPIMGVNGLAASSSMAVAGLVKGIWEGDSYGYTALSLNLKRGYSFQPLAYTTNGTSWDFISLSQRAGIYDVIHNNGRFIAVGSVVGGSPQAWYSSNGLSWTAVGLPTGTYISLAAGNGKVVAVGYPTNRQSFATNWAGPYFRSAFVGGGMDDGSLSQRVLVSSDNGTTWTSVDGLPLLETWIKVAFVPSIASFVAFAVGNQVAAVSADGVNWDPVFRGTSSSVYGCHSIIDGDLYQPAGGYNFGKDAWKMTFTSTGGTGGTATFSVTATAATAISYQWQVSTDFGTSFTNLSGKTSSTLSLTGLTAGDNGNRYRCRLTSGSTTVLSSVAILTVTS